MRLAALPGVVSRPRASVVPSQRYLERLCIFAHGLLLVAFSRHVPSRVRAFIRAYRELSRALSCNRTFAFISQYSLTTYPLAHVLNVPCLVNHRVPHACCVCTPSAIQPLHMPSCTSLRYPQSHDSASTRLLRSCSWQPLHIPSPLTLSLSQLTISAIPCLVTHRCTSAPLQDLGAAGQTKRPTSVVLLRKESGTEVEGLDELIAEVKALPMPA